MQGRRHRPTPESKKKVKMLAAYGLVHEEIAYMIGCCVEALRKHYPKELKMGLSEVNAKVAERLFVKCMRDETDPIKFWLTHRAGLTHTVKNEITGANGGAIKTEQGLNETDREILKRFYKTQEDKL